MPLAYLGAPSTVGHPHAYPVAPYALCGVRHGQIINPSIQMVNPGLMYPTQMFPQCDTPYIHPHLQAPLALVPYYLFPYVVVAQHQ